MILVRPIRNFIKLSDYSYKLIKKCCGGDRMIDLLFHFPSGVMKRASDISNFSARDKLTVVITITDHVPPSYRGKPYKIIGQTNNGDIVTVIYFNYRVPYLIKTFPINSTLTISGSAERTYDGIQISHPDIIAPAEHFKYYVGTEPIYPLTGNLSNKTLKFTIHSLLKFIPKDFDYLQSDVREKFQLPGFYDSLHGIHYPKSEADLTLSSAFRRRIAIDELLANQIRFTQLRNTLTLSSALSFSKNGSILNRLILPFELTEDQVLCLKEIEDDLKSDKAMNRLIQGDVGSGKTVVAFISMLIAIENGLQVAMLAPTEILAWQHFETIQKLSDGLNLDIDVMLSSNRKARKRQIKDLLDGTTQILVGTHAMLEENIEFRNLGLIVIDEQHRFGVMQRFALIKKCKYPNILAMSATPIPRTLLLGCYGDLDVSIIKQKPSGRMPIETAVISTEKIESLIARLKNMNTQIFWVCPVIDESDSLVDVNTRCEYLQKSFAENDVKVLHGKMKSVEKDRIMESFKNNEFKLLVSTTVIEVGVDIPNANVMVIEHAERFGLAQLHQLRGRVGRGKEQAYCVLIYHFPVSKIGQQRLQLMKSTDNGFILSEEDLKLRGAGDVLGKEQSGFNSLRFSDFSDNYSLIERAEQISKVINIDSEDVKNLCEIFNRVSNECIV
ncbi:MAG: ATP-dependent DNA helicase RecG [Alphaproteobacteria bacterium]|nr:ATP-dependent DNA helicase RecG [Alphaproteobacteria bacterium]